MLRLPLALLMTVWALPALAQPVQVFVEDLKVELDNWDARKAEAFGKALAADLQGAIVKNPAFRPMTYENLQSQLRKEKRAEELSCSQTDQACIQKILDNYGCEERLYGTVRQVGDQAQVSLTRYRNEQLVESGAVSAYGKASASDITATAARLARELFRAAANQGPMPGQEGAIGTSTDDWTPELQAKVVVSFETEPVGALVEVDGDVLCEAPCSKSLVRGRHHVTLKKARYRTWEGDLDAERATTLRQSLSPAFGWLTVRSEPTGLAVTLDGRPFGTTGALERREQDPGLYEVSLADERYESAGERVQLEAGEDRKITLVPKLKQGALQVEVVDDAGNAVAADVAVDGESVGTSPWAGKLMVGPHKLTTRAPDGRTAEKTVTLVYRQVGAETLKLPALPARSAGHRDTPILNSRASDADSATWTDPSTGLEWQRVSPDKQYDWEDAKSYCDRNAAGLPASGWHLPTIAELKTILVKKKIGSCYWPRELKGVCDWYWSSSLYISKDSFPWTVTFNYGNVNNFDKANAGGVRCVRVRH